MTIQKGLWDLFKTFLFYERKLKPSKANLYSLASRFHKLATYFETVDFNRDNFTKFIKELSEQGYKPAYLNSFIKTAKLLDKYLKTNFLADYTYFKVRFVPHEILSPSQILDVINCPRHYKNRSPAKNTQINAKFKALFTLMAYTGCRVGEAVDLKAEDIFPTYVIFRDTKTNEDRVVPISDETYSLLKELPITKGKKFGIAFTSRVNQELYQRGKILSLPPLSSHIFRYSFITTMCSIIGEDSVMRIVGHKDPASTARYNQKRLEQLRTDVLKHPNLKNSLSLSYISEVVTKSVGFLTGSSRFSLQVTNHQKKFILVIADNGS